MKAELDPALAAVIAAIPSWAGLETEVAPITIGMTNSNYKVRIGDERFVVRLGGKNTDLLGIDRTSECAAARAAAAEGVGPEVFAYLPDRNALITRFVQGVQISEEHLQGGVVMAAVVRSIKAIHACREISATFPVFRIIKAYRNTAALRGIEVPATFAELWVKADEIEGAFSSRPSVPCLCHIDLLSANLLQEGHHIWIVDYEYSGMGDCFFDLGNLSANNGFGPEADELLLRLYLGRVTDSQRARLQLMRIVSDLREGIWGVVQQAVSTLDFDYVGYAERHLARCLACASDERFGDWLHATASGAMDCPERMG